MTGTGRSRRWRRPASRPSGRPKAGCTRRGTTTGRSSTSSSPQLEVAALRVHVFSLEDVMTGKLLAITEQEPDFGQLLSYARSLREQIDWDEVRARTESSPFARAFFTLVEGLGIVDSAPALDFRESSPSSHSVT